MASKMTKTKLKKLLAEIGDFDPKAPGPMQAILAVGNREYYRQRALECLANPEEGPQLRKANTRKAITLLLIYLWELNNEQEISDGLGSGAGELESRGQSRPERVTFRGNAEQAVRGPSQD